MDEEPEGLAKAGVDRSRFDGALCRRDLQDGVVNQHAREILLEVAVKWRSLGDDLKAEELHSAPPKAGDTSN